MEKYLSKILLLGLDSRELERNLSKKCKVRNLLDRLYQAEWKNTSVKQCFCDNCWPATVRRLERYLSKKCKARNLLDRLHQAEWKNTSVKQCFCDNCQPATVRRLEKYLSKKAVIVAAFIWQKLKDWEKT